MWPCPLRSKDAVVAPSLSRSLYSARELVVFPFVTIFFYDSFVFLVSFRFLSRFWFLGSLPQGCAGSSSPWSFSQRTQGGERKERCGFDANGTPSRSARPALGTARGGGWQSAAKVGHQQPRGMAGAERQEHRNASVPAPACSPAWPLSCLGCPGEPQRAMAAWGLLPVGGWCWCSPGPLPVHSPVPGRHSSQGWAVWHPARQPGLRRGHQPRPWGHGRVVSPVCCLAPGSCSYLCPDDINQGSPVPRPAGWTARCPRPVGSEGPAGLRPPERRGFIHNLVEYFQCYPGLGLAGAGGAVSGPTAALSPPALAGAGGEAATPLPGSINPAWPLFCMIN